MAAKIINSKGIAVLFLFVFSIFFFTEMIFALPKVDTKMAMKSYIEKNGKDPDKYVLDLFKTKDIVILGEFNRIKHEIEFVKSLIPALYYNGIYDLAMEFGNKEDQEKVDKLVTASSFNSNLAIEIMRNFQEYGIWGYKEYFDIFKAAWNINQSLPISAPRFRIIFLSSQNGYDKNKFNAKNIFMANIITNEITSKGRKALVYITNSHTENCMANLKKTGFGKIVINSCLAEILKEKYPNKIFSVIFHSPWIMIDKNRMSLNGIIKPLDGEIDVVFDLIGNNRVAFNIGDSPIKDLSEKRSVYYELDTNYTLKCICDGYIFIKPYDEYEYASWITDFINEDFLPEVKNYYKKINYDLMIETTGYANDLCSATGYTLYDTIRRLKSQDYVKLYSDLRRAIKD